MKIQFMSDLHLELQGNSRFLKYEKIPITGDILVLAGDIFYLKNRVAPLANFWKWASEQYRQVLIVPGNHEYYNYTDIMERGLKWTWMFKENVGYYQNQVIRVDDIDFILSTLWSNIPSENEYYVWNGMNDFRQIMYNGKLLRPEDYNRIHAFCFDFIQKSVVESMAKHIIVVTHHLPTRQAVAAKHLGSSINSAFATELGGFIAHSRIDYWIYGHSHTNIDTAVGSTKLVCNQLGYVFANEHIMSGFDAGKFVEV